MNILITGGTGLIGREFIRQFSQYKYTVLTRSALKAKRLLPDSVSFIESLDQLENLDAYDAVINLAGEPIVDKRWSEKQKLVIRQSRWKTTRKLVDLFQNSSNPPKVFLSGSAIGVYGNRAVEPLTESSSICDDDFPSQVCERWESIAKRPESVTRVVLLRTGIVLSNQGGALAKMLVPFKLCLGGKIGSGKQYMSWIHIADYIKALDFVLTNEQLKGPVNLVSPNAATNQTFTKTLAKALNRLAVIPLPAWLLHLLMGESSALLLDSQNVVPEKLINAGFGFQFKQLEPALANLVSGNKQTESTL